jgi:hypothetical protein
MQDSELNQPVRDRRLAMKFSSGSGPKGMEIAGADLGERSKSPQGRLGDSRAR